MADVSQNHNKTPTEILAPDNNMVRKRPQNVEFTPPRQRHRSRKVFRAGAWNLGREHGLTHMESVQPMKRRTYAMAVVRGAQSRVPAAVIAESGKLVPNTQLTSEDTVEKIFEVPSKKIASYEDSMKMMDEATSAVEDAMLALATSLHNTSQGFHRLFDAERRLQEVAQDAPLCRSEESVSRCTGILDVKYDSQAGSKRVHAMMDHCSGDTMWPCISMSPLPFEHDLFNQVDWGDVLANSLSI